MVYESNHSRDAGMAALLIILCLLVEIHIASDLSDCLISYHTDPESVLRLSSDDPSTAYRPVPAHYALPAEADIYLGVLFIHPHHQHPPLISGRPGLVCPAVFFTCCLPDGSARIFCGGERLCMRIGIAVIAAVVIEPSAIKKNNRATHSQDGKIIGRFQPRHHSSCSRKAGFTCSARLPKLDWKQMHFLSACAKAMKLRLELLFDDGEFYENQRVKLEGSLSGWVLDNQKKPVPARLAQRGAFIPRAGWRCGKAQEQPFVEWVCPCEAKNVDGLIAISSYHPTPSDHADLELLTSWRNMPPRPLTTPTTMRKWNTIAIDS